MKGWDNVLSELWSGSVNLSATINATILLHFCTCNLTDRLGKIYAGDVPLNKVASVIVYDLPVLSSCMAKCIYKIPTLSLCLSSLLLIPSSLLSVLWCSGRVRLPELSRSSRWSLLLSPRWSSLLHIIICTVLYQYCTSIQRNILYLELLINWNPPKFAHFSVIYIGWTWFMCISNIHNLEMLSVPSLPEMAVVLPTSSSPMSWSFRHIHKLVHQHLL